MDKILWKSGQMHLDDVKESFFNLKTKGTDKWLTSQLNEKLSLTNKAFDK